jgi:hypothetical protein
MRILKGLMRKACLLPVVLLIFVQATTLAGGGQAAGTATLSNGDVIKMVQAKLSDAVVVTTIKSSSCKFDTSPGTLIHLKEAGVSDAVLQAMAESGGVAAKPAGNMPPTPVATSSVSGLPTEVGVYFKKGDEWVEVHPEVVNWKTGGVLKTIGTGGIVKGDINGHINGRNSHNSVRSPLEFLICTPEGVDITEYQLLRLREQKDAREFRTVTGGVMHVSGGATRDLVPFDGKKIASRTFSATLINIGAGEYGFLPPGAAVSSHASATLGKMYTFHLLE